MALMKVLLVIVVVVVLLERFLLASRKKRDKRCSISPKVVYFVIVYNITGFADPL